jgi:hypothetical protein
MENKTIQTPIQEEIPNQPVRRLPLLSRVLVFISVFLLLSTAFLAYQNVQLKTQITSLKTGSFDTSQTALDQEVSVTPSVDQKQQNNNWRTYDGPGVSFQYPNGWPDLQVNQLASRQEILAEGVFKMEAGSYYSSKLGRNMTFQEYRDEVIQQESNGQEVDYSLGGLNGVMYGMYRNEIMTTRIFLVSNNDKQFIYNLTFSFPTPDITEDESLLEPILATFKFK